MAIAYKYYYYECFGSQIELIKLTIIKLTIKKMRPYLGHCPCLKIHIHQDKSIPFCFKCTILKFSLEAVLIF